MVFVGDIHDPTHGILVIFDFRLMQEKYALDLMHHSWVSEVTYAPTGDVIAVCGAAGIDIFDVESPRTCTPLFSDEPVLSVTYTPSGNYLVAGTQYELLLFHIAAPHNTMERLPLPWRQGYHLSSVKVLEISYCENDGVEEH